MIINSKIQPLVDELLECRACIAIKKHKARTGRILRVHRQDGNVAVDGIGNLAR